MAELKTQATTAAPLDLIASVHDEERRENGKTLLDLFEKITKQPPIMWGPTIIGFGKYSYVYDSGHKGEMCKIGFSPRKRELVLYLQLGAEGFEELLQKLGKHKAGKGCLYIKRLSDIKMDVLEKMIDLSYKKMCEKYGAD